MDPESGFIAGGGHPGSSNPLNPNKPPPKPKPKSIHLHGNLGAQRALSPYDTFSMVGQQHVTHF